jgi:DNA (cytosine-5)-methyltransferase 1
VLNVLDIFSGIGGFSIGLEAVGMKTVAFCEINPFCQKILTRHWPSVPIFFDITVIDKEDLKALPPIHVIAGGFPCQDISVAGKGGGINAKRSGLWKEFVRLINEVRPKYAIIENVANLRSQGLTRVLQDLWEIGYDAEWHCIPASAFGAPHRRDRIWIIATPLASAKSDCPSERRRQSPHLEAVVKMLPTPTARDYKDVGDLKKLAQYAHKSRLACTIAAEALSNGEKSLQKYQD